MDKVEYLNILRQSLSGEVSSVVIEQNIDYYEGYISSTTKEEENRIIGELGDPRLIAKTIIETDRIAKEKGKYTSSQGVYTAYSTAEEENEKARQEQQGYGKSMFFTNMNWYHKLLVILVVIAVIAVIAIVGRLILGFLFAFGLPIILLLLVFSLFRKR